MIWATPDDFEQEMRTTIDSCEEVMFFTIGKEFQIDAIKTLDNLLAKIRLEKEKAITVSAEKRANIFLYNEFIVECFRDFAKMWVQLKEDAMDEAWESLIDAQMAISDALCIYDDPELHIVVERLDQFEKIIFPPQMFASVGLTILESKCSICDEEYGECGHMKHRVYMGKKCSRNITKWKLNEWSIVTNPANKRCRAYAYGPAGKKRNCMTGRLAPPDENELRLPSDPNKIV